MLRSLEHHDEAYGLNDAEPNAENGHACQHAGSVSGKRCQDRSGCRCDDRWSYQDSAIAVDECAGQQTGERGGGLNGGKASEIL
jgi:hypothetical protein